MSSGLDHRRVRLERWDGKAGALGTVGAALIVVAAIAALLIDPSTDPGIPPGYGPPSKFYLALWLGGAAAIGFIGVARQSRPLIGAAGGLILPVGLMSFLVVPAALLIGACGVLPTRRKPDRAEFAAGIVIVLLGLAPVVLPPLVSAPKCWVEIQDPSGSRTEFTDGLVTGVAPGQLSATCAERVPEPAAFPLAAGFVVVAIGLALHSSRRRGAMSRTFEPGVRRRKWV